jgi:transitional endoplasmic reticulum ATPase
MNWETYSSRQNDPSKTYFDHSSAQRVNTNVVMTRALHQKYPSLELVMVPEGSCDLFKYATKTAKASFRLIDDDSADKSTPQSLLLTGYRPALHRSEEGHLSTEIVFGKFQYTWQGIEFIVYFANGRDGAEGYPIVPIFYILATEKAEANGLVEAAGRWTSELHDEVWVYDSGYWQKSAELYESARNASWDNVILDPAMKKALIDDHLTFFKSKDRYLKLQVPWKRGVIYYGPPGNGKTISIKAMMHTLYSLPDPIPTLYVRSLTSVSMKRAARWHQG